MNDSETCVSDRVLRLTWFFLDNHGYIIVQFYAFYFKKKTGIVGITSPCTGAFYYVKSMIMNAVQLAVVNNKFCT